MKIAIIFFTMLSILGTGSLKLNDDTEISVNWFALIDLVLIIIYFWG